jgi:hypothetical protein
VLIGVVVLLFGLMSTPKRTTANGVRPLSPQPSQAGASRSADSVSISVISDPPGARVVVSGVYRGDTPLTVNIPKGSPVLYAVGFLPSDPRARQFKSYSGTLNFNRNDAVSVWLDRLPPPRPAVTTSRPPIVTSSFRSSADEFDVDGWGDDGWVEGEVEVSDSGRIRGYLRLEDGREVDVSGSMRGNDRASVTDDDGNSYSLDIENYEEWLEPRHVIVESPYESKLWDRYRYDAKFDPMNGVISGDVEIDERGNVRGHLLTDDGLVLLNGRMTDYGRGRATDFDGRQYDLEWQRDNFPSFSRTSLPTTRSSLPSYERPSVQSAPSYRSPLQDYRDSLRTFGGSSVGGGIGQRTSSFPSLGTNTYELPSFRSPLDTP